MANGKVRTPAQVMAAKVVGLSRANAKVIHVCTGEEFRSIMAIAEEAAKSKAAVFCADSLLGITDAKGDEVPPGRKATSPESWLMAVRDCPVKSIWVMKDLLQPGYMQDPRIVRTIRHLAQWLVQQEPSRTIVLLSPRNNAAPPELSDVIVPVDLDLPDRTELGQIFDTAVMGQRPADGETDVKKIEAYAKAKASPRAESVEAAVGLSSSGAILCYKQSIVTHKGTIDPVLIAKEKGRIIKGAGIELYPPDEGGLSESVAGLELMKEWLEGRRGAFSEEAKAYGLPKPKGIIIVGVPGGGKSLTAKCVSTTWQLPLIRLDIGRMMGGIVGDTEANTESAFKRIKAVGNCIVWLDEIEKSFAGLGGSHDGGVAMRQFGLFLTWMNEREGGSFVIATANNVQALPPEFLRKGRFDEIWAVDLPTTKEREAILRVALRKNKRDKVMIDAHAVAVATKNFVGSEIACLVVDAMYAAFADKAREITTEDLLRAAKRVIPLAITAAEKITALRDWVKSGKARPASLPEEA